MAAGRSSTSNAARWAAVAAVGSRVLLVVVAFVTAATVGVRARAQFLRDPRAEALSGFAERLFEPWAHWDGVWFIRIAADGYAAHDYSQAFFPLYPLLLRLVAPLTGGDYVVAGVLVSLACYGGAMALLYRLVRSDLGPRVALWSVVLISVFPTALVFQAVYSESLFLLLVLASFTAARQGRWWAAGLAGLLAVLTRSAGLALLVPLALMWWEQRRGAAVRLPGGPAAGKPAARRPSPVTLLALLLVPAGLGLYMAYLWSAFGDPLLFGVVQGNWGRTMAAPWAAIAVGAEEAARGIAWLVTNGPQAVLGMRNESGGIPIQQLANVLEFAGLLVAVALAAVCWRRLPAAYTVYAVAALVFPLFYPSDGRPLSSLPRFVLVDFPFFVALAVVLVPHRVTRWAVSGLFLVLLIVATVYFASWA